MADLSSILKDPNFVNANAATQQAIFDKWAPQDPNFANANSETQAAIRQKFGVGGGVSVSTGGIPTGRSLADQIPGYDRPVPVATTPIRTKPTSFVDKLRGAVETGATLVSGAVTAPVVEASKIYGALTSGQFGTPEGLQAGERTGQRMAQQIQYQPRTQTGQEYTADVANALARTGLQGVPLNVLADFQRGAIPAVQAGVDYTRGAQAARATRLAEEASAKDWARASQIDAAQAAQRLGVAVNPAEANPNVKTKMLVGATGEALVNAKAVRENMPKWNELARQDLGLPANTPLTPKAFEQARKAHSAPYDAIRKMGTLHPSNEVIGQIDQLRLDPLSTSNPAKAAAVNAVVDRTMGQIATGLTGENVVGQIRGFRDDAIQVLKNPNATSIETSVAEANLGIANALENLIEGNIANPKMLDEFRAARTALAKTYDWERATGVTTKQVDPAVIAKLAEKGKPLTGKLADVANVAGNFPEAASLNVPREPLLYQRLRRGGVGGTAGFALGGGPVGAAVGAGITSLGGEVLANMLARPGVQNRLAMPPDRRIPLPTTPVEPMAPIPQSRAVVPFDYSQQAFVPPNFVMVPEQYGPRVGPAPTPEGVLRGLPSPSAEGTMGALRAEDVRRAGVSRAVGQQAEAQQAAAEAAARRPTSGEVILDINPLTGVPEISKGIKGATPDVIESANKAAASAAEKIRAGQAFLMTADEKIQWAKSWLAGMPIAQGETIFGKLTPQQIANKMADRDWAAQAVTKARDQAAAFEQIAARAKDAQAKAKAMADRERMLDLAEQMEEGLRNPRPVSTGGQGPKTRAFQRNRLNPDQEVLNQLLGK